MNRAEIEQGVKKVIRDVTGNKELIINSNSALIEDLGLDSVDFASLVMALEDEFGGTVEDEESANLVTVKDVVDHIEQQLVMA